MKAVRILHELIRQRGWATVPVIAREVIFRVARLTPGIENLEATVFGAKILVPVKHDGIGRALYVYGGRELDHKWMLEKVLKPGDVIFDLGANIGYYAILEAEIVQRRCKIFAIEPDPRNVRLLTENIRHSGLQDIVTIESGAVSNYSGRGYLLVSSRSNLNRLRRDQEETSLQPQLETRVYDFAEYLEKIVGRVSLVRMDIEGGEIKIFDSLLRALEKSQRELVPRRIIFETHDYGSERGLMKELLTALLKDVYDLEFLSSDDEASGSPEIQSQGYRPFKVIDDGPARRGIYAGINDLDAAELISRWKGTRTVCLKLKE